MTPPAVSRSRLAIAVPRAPAQSVVRHPRCRPAQQPHRPVLWTRPWALTLKHKTAFVDLTGRSRIHWRTRNSGFRRTHVILKLADGNWLISDQSDGASADWRVREFNVADLTWHKLDIVQVVEGAAVEHPNLSKVDEIGFTDLMNGASSSACTRLDWFEVYGKVVKRKS